jgi:hypothetical protein
MQQTGTLIRGVLTGALAALLTIFAMIFCFHKVSSTSEDNKTLQQKCYKTFPLVALFVGMFALIFQITVLYPWHIELSEELKNLASRI